MNTFIYEFLGFVGCICFSFAFLPQTIKSIKTKDVNGISLTSYIMNFAGAISMAIYGIYLSSFQLIFFNTISATFAFIMLYIKIRYGNK